MVNRSKKATIFAIMREIKAQLSAKSLAKVKRVIPLFLLVFSFNSFADRAAQASQLLNYFGEGCSAKNQWTNEALNNSMALIESLRQIENDEDCKTTSSVINNLSQFNQYVDQISADENSKELLALQNQQQYLLDVLSQTSSPEEIMMINAELRAIQMQIATLEGYQSWDGSNLNSTTEQNIRNLLSTTGTVLDTMQANEGCWSKYPGILSSTANLASSVASSLGGSVYALIFSAAADLLGQVVEFSRKYAIRRRINKESFSLTSTAFHCALEKMSKSWCGAEDARKAIELKERTLTQNLDDDLWQGIRIHDREMPIFLSWLKEVRAGTDPTTQAEAGRQTRVLYRQAQVQTAPKTVVGIISENEDTFNIAGSRDAKWRILRTVLSSIVSAVNMGSNSPGVFLEIYPRGYAPYYLLGLEDNDEIRNNNGEYISLANFSLPTALELSLAEVQKRFDQWTELADETVQRELIQVLQVDPLGVINNAIDNQGIPTKITPRAAIKTIKKFLIKNIPESYISSSHRKIYEDTVRTLEIIGSRIDLVFQTEDPLAPKDALKEISQASKLTFGTVFLKNRIVRSIRFALNDIVFERRNNGDTLSSQLLAAEDIIEALNKYNPSGTTNLTALRQGIDQAQSISQKTMSNFTKFFGRKIKRVLKEYNKLSERASESNYGPNNRAKAALCLKLMAIDKWPKKIPFKFCEGTQLHHANPKGPKSKKLTKELLAQPFAKRVCLHRDFLRRSLIFQNHRITVSED